jgi:putrescine transport system substrate-binding protein
MAIHPCRIRVTRQPDFDPFYRANPRETAIMRNALLAAAFTMATVFAAGPVLAQDMDKEKVLNVYNWADYFAPDTLKNFTKKYGIQVHYDTFGSDNEMEAKLMAGSTGYDVVVPSTMFYPRGIHAGIYQKLDKAAMPNWKNLDTKVLDQISSSGTDPGNDYAMPYIIGYTGFIYNKEAIDKVLPNAPVDSLRLLFDPAIANKIKECGINYVDSPEDVVQLALIYLGKSPNDEDPKDIAAAYALLKSVHGTVRTIDSNNYLNALAAGDICVSVGWVGNDVQAQAQAKAAGKTFHLQFVLPKEGTPEYIDNMVITTDAPHPKNAALFLNYIMDSQNSAAIINSLGYPMANAAAMSSVKPDIAHNPTIYPDADTMKRVILQTPRTTEANQAVSSGWVNFKAGQ